MLNVMETRWLKECMRSERYGTVKNEEVRRKMGMN